MDLNKLIDSLLTEVNVKRTWEGVAYISLFNRFQASKGYHQDAELIIKEL